MSREQIETITCDGCGTAARSDFAGLPAGWLTVEVGRESFGNQQAGDWCSFPCLAQWVLARVPKTTGPKP